MALAQVYTAAPGDTITAARWNNEFGNIYNNGTSLVFPATTAVSFNGKLLVLDTAGQTFLSSSATRGFTFVPGAKSSTPGLGGAGITVEAQTSTDNNTAASGTAAAQTFTSFSQPTQAASNTNVTVTSAATVYIAGAPINGTNVTITNPYALWIDSGNSRFDGVVQAGSLLGVAAFGGYMQGLTYQPNVADATNDIDIAVGMAVSSDTLQADRRTMVLTSALTKQSDVAWSVGNGGLLDTGVIGNNGYYLWLIMRTDLTVVDAVCSLSSTSPTMPADYTFKRRIGWFLRSGGAIVAFTTYETFGGGLELLWSVPTLDINLAATLTTSRRTDAVKVPLNISTIAHLNIVLSDASANSRAWIYCPDHTDTAPSDTVAPLANMTSVTTASVGASQRFIRTSATGTIAARGLLSTFDLYAVSTIGFTMSRRT